MRDKTTLILGVVWLSVAAALFTYLFVKSASPTIRWNTETEQNTAGFQIYRSNSVDGEFELITEEIIPSSGSANSGGSYSFTDNTAVPGETYYYLLEEIEYDGTLNQYTEDIISERVRINNLAIFLVALITLVGLGFIISGIREGR